MCHCGPSLPHGGESWAMVEESWAMLGESWAIQGESWDRNAHNVTIIYWREIVTISKEKITNTTIKSKISFFIQ